LRGDLSSVATSSEWSLARRALRGLDATGLALLLGERREAAASEEARDAVREP